MRIRIQQCLSIQPVLNVRQDGIHTNKTGRGAGLRWVRREALLPAAERCALVNVNVHTVMIAGLDLVCGYVAVLSNESTPQRSFLGVVIISTSTILFLVGYHHQR